MEYFPLFTRIKGYPCLIVGGGVVALRKTRLLLKAQADITVIAPEIHNELARLHEHDKLLVRQESFLANTPVDHFRLIVAATDNPALNQQVAAAAEAAGVFCNVVDDRALSTAIMPAMVDRAPLIIAVSSGGESPVLATMVRQQIERTFPPAFATLARFAGAWRATVKQRITDLSQRRRFWQTVLAGPIATQVLNGNLDAAGQNIEAELAGNTTQTGIAWIVGAGPGDPELLTLKAARVLASADIILHDRLVAPAILEFARKDAEFISVGKQAGKASISQAEINRLLIQHVAAGKRVCRLKGGDPFIFGRGGEELEALAEAGLPWQVIPGITAASGCAAHGSPRAGQCCWSVRSSGLQETKTPPSPSPPSAPSARQRSSATI